MIAGIGIGNMLLSFCGVSFLGGLTKVLSTLIPNASGAGDLDLCGVYVNRCRMIILVFMVPISIIILNIEKVLIVIGQDPKAS